MKIESRMVALLIVALLSVEVMAQSMTDATKVLTDRLIEYGPVQKTGFRKETVCTFERCPKNFIECYCARSETRDIPYVYSAPLTVTRVFVTDTRQFLLASPMKESIANRAIVQTQRNANCSSIPLNAGVSLTVGGSEQDSTTITRGISNTDGTTLGFSAPVGKFGQANVAKQLTRTVNFSQTRTEGRVDTVTRSHTGSQLIPPNTATVIKLLAWETKGVIPLSALVTIDGELDGNNRGLKLASEVLSAEQRTIQIEGNIDLTVIGDAIVSSYDEPLACLNEEDGLTIDRSPIVRSPDLRPEAFNALTIKSQMDLSRVVLGRRALGGICYIGPCDPSGSGRLVCYLDDETGCWGNCMLEPDPSCVPPEPER